MAKLTLTSPITVDPRQGGEVFIRAIEVDAKGDAIRVTAELRNAQGDVILTKDFPFKSPAVTAWIRSVEPDALALVRDAMGVTGTIA